MKLRFTPRAVQDIAAIADYIRERNPGAAERVRTAILQSFQNLLLFPRMGRAQTVEGVRKLVTRHCERERSDPSRCKRKLGCFVRNDGQTRARASDDRLRLARVAAFWYR